MQVSVETTSPLGRRVKVAVPAEQLEKAFSDRLKTLSRQVKLPGFRPGKVPIKMVEARYGGQVMQEIAGDLIQRTFQEAIGREGLKPVSGPTIRHKPLARGQEFEYTAEFEVYPDILRLELNEARIDRPVATIAEEDIDRTLDTIRHQRVTFQPVQRSARLHDRLVIDFIGRHQGTEFEGGKAENFAVVLGAAQLLDGFEEALVGASAGEQRAVSASFPAGYRNPALAGQPVEIALTNKEDAEPMLPELNEELAKQLGVVDGKVETLRNEVRANLERQAASRSQAVVRRQVLQALLAANPIELPLNLVAAEVERLKRLAHMAREAGVATTLPEASEEAAMRERARVRVALGLILTEVIRTRGIKADPERVRGRIEQMAAEYDAPEKYMQWHYASPERLAEVESAVMEERVVDELLATAQIDEKAVGFQELLAMDVSLH